MQSGQCPCTQGEHETQQNRKLSPYTAAKGYTVCLSVIVWLCQVMTDRWKSAERTQDIRAVMMKLSDQFSPSFGGQVIFRLFGPYEGIPNLLFTVI